MDAKDYVSFEAAKKLKIAGFSEKCRSVWHFDGEKADFIEDYPATFHGEPNDFNKSDIFGLYVYSAPMLWQVQKWLHDKKNLDIHFVLNCITDENNVDFDKHYLYVISNNHNGRQLSSGFLSADVTYSYALSTAIDAALELINKNE